ncbi:M20 metallopeptidase family protein [Micromonospora sagamiensis]|uniref:Amidohydrolase/hippurate hydrolase n=1 Tax=Micromonospora sagamiensis TaxID=47875 RepID=A0A562WK54_9ACTN|nr:M20 family metallopeptidase [Micromonospora sagamiensis]TWJ30421.1 amidohydrolase/hippurate hydrolase [Micromonospora sagamiensis]BCL16549.1 peptidase M20 [Micromonospora sagamiensis]
MVQAHEDVDDLVKLRRQLHRHPELRFTEHGTAATLAGRLAPIARVRTGIAGTGLLAEIDGRATGPAVLLRADMDAYPVQDAKAVGYASGNPGVCHACGHDVHMAVVYGVAARLAADPPARGTVTLLFQPAEEIPFGEASGAAAALADEALRGRRYDAVLGLHCWPDLPVGAVGVDRETAMAAKDAFRIEVLGRAAHAATPALGRDAILGLSGIVNLLHAGVARSRNPHELVAFNIGTISGGASQSQVAAYAEATGTLRTHDEATRGRLKEVIERIARQQAAALDLGVRFTWANEMPPVRNAASLVTLAHAELPGVVEVADLTEPPLTTDDFALLGVLGPSLYVKLGVTGERGGAPLHSGAFDVDERCLGAGVTALERLTRAVLDGRLGGGDDGPTGDGTGAAGDGTAAPGGDRTATDVGRSAETEAVRA